MLVKVSRPYDQKEVFTAWKQWERLLESTLKRRTRFGRATQQRYQDLHQRLTLLLKREQAYGNHDYRELCRHCERMLRPWVHIETVQYAERRVVVDLLAQVKQASAELAPSSTRLLRTGLAVTAITLSALIVLFVVLILGAEPSDGMPPWKLLQLEALKLWQRVQISFFEIPLSLRLLIGAVAVIGTGMLLMRSTRKY